MSRTYPPPPQTGSSVLQSDTGAPPEWRPLAYCCVYTTQQSTASLGPVNPFDEDNYASYGSTAVVTAAGITYDSTDGSFTVDAAGIYKVDITNMLLATSSAIYYDLRVYVDGVQKYVQGFIRANSAVQPTPHTAAILLSCAASDPITYTITISGAGAITFACGKSTTMTINRIA